MYIHLQPHHFLEKEKLLIEDGQLEASIFRYETGVCAIRLQNALGYIIILPYLGQMIWDAVFDDRSIVMKTPFIYPKQTRIFHDTYGCYLMYCGALRLSSQDPEDDFIHDPHGELPTAQYDNAAIMIGNDEKGRYIAVTGEYEYNRSFGDRYTAAPIVKLYENSGMLDISMNIKNLSGYPMELMFMFHVNNVGVHNGRIVQSCDWSTDDMIVSKKISPGQRVREGFMELLHKVEKDPSITRTLRDDIDYNPQILIEMPNYRTDENGDAYVMQIHPDGSSDFIKFKPSELKVCTRWIATSNVDGINRLALALPATCGLGGYIKEKAKNRIEEIDPSGSFTATIQVGYLNKEETVAMENLVNAL